MPISSYRDVAEDLKKRGVEALNMIVGISFAESNKNNGKKSYGEDRPNLHKLVGGTTPYLDALQVIAGVMDNLDPDQIYPVYRFATRDTKDVTVLPLLFPEEDDAHFVGCRGVTEAYLRVLSEASPISVEIAGPTVFTPLIRQALRVCQADPKHLYVLFVLADEESINPKLDKATLEETQGHPLYVVIVYIGDGPFRGQRAIMPKISSGFTNFHIVDFTTEMARQREKHAGGLQEGDLEVRVHEAIRAEVASNIFTHIVSFYRNMRDRGTIGPSPS